MTAVGYRVAVDLRRRWRVAAGLALLVAFLGGVVLATVAGARRTASAYDRLEAQINPPDLLVSPSGDPNVDPAPLYGAIAAMPEVRALRLFGGIPGVPEAGTPSERLGPLFEGLGIIAPLASPPGGESVGRVKVIDGRLPDPTRADEILVTTLFARLGDVAVGDTIDLVLAPELESENQFIAPRSAGVAVTATVTGIGTSYDEVVPFSDLDESGSLFATPALAALVDRTMWNFEGALVDAEPGTDLTALTAAIEEVSVGVAADGGVFISDQEEAAQQTRDAIRPLSAALAVAAFAIGAIALLVIAQAISRTTREGASTVEALRALGVQRRERVWFAVARVAVVASVGAVGAVAVAVALSGLFPFGVAEDAEPAPGTRLDVTVLVAGALVLIAVSALSAVPAALLAHRARAVGTRQSRLATGAAASGLAPSAVQGIRFATLGSAGRQVPIRSTVLAVTAAIVAVLATVTFGQSLVALVETPEHYGQRWDRMVDAQFGPAPVSRVIEAVESLDLSGIAVGNYGDVSVNGVAVPAFDLTPVSGDVSVGILEGVAATRAGEIVLGGQTMDALGVDVGDEVTIDAGDGETTMTVTGRGVFPRLGQGSFSTTGLGIGAQLGGSVLPSFGDFGEVPPAYELDGRRYNFIALATDGSTEELDRVLASLEPATIADGAFAFVRGDQPPAKIRDLDRVRVVPAVMAGLLALVAVAALAHVLVTSVRERRRELALLRTLGFRSSQLRATVAWHATTIAVVALVVGAPLGILLGRFVWQRYADGLYAFAPAETPWLWLLVTVLATIVVANIVAAIPAGAASRTRPAAMLREE